MEGQTGRLWLINAFAVFLLALLLWTVLTIFAAMALGAEAPGGLLLSSKLRADYSADPLGFTLRTIRLALLGDLLGDGTSGGLNLERYLQGAVPTATPADLYGSTATPTPSVPTATPAAQPTHTPSPPASATPIPSPSATPDPAKDLYPILECVEQNADGTYTAHFGYQNKGSQAVEIPIGPRNGFAPDPQDRGQPTRFEPGRTPKYPQAAFSVVFDGGDLIWTLGERKVKAKASSPACQAPGASPSPTPTPKATATPADDQYPELEGGTLSPTPGPLDSCSTTIEITDLRVYDPAPSAGIDWVKLKYRVEGYTDLIYSDPLTLTSGGWQEDGSWDGYYQGTIDVRIDPEWESPAPDPFRISLWAKARDKAGHETYLYLGEYTMPASCGKSSGPVPDDQGS